MSWCEWRLRHCCKVGHLQLQHYSVPSWPWDQRYLTDSLWVAQPLQDLLPEDVVQPCPVKDLLQGVDLLEFVCGWVHSLWRSPRGEDPGSPISSWA